jgi:hypothetical protein
MSKKDRQKLSILVILLAVLGLTVVLAYRMNQPTTTAAVQLPQAKPSTNAPAPSDGQIRLDLLAGSGSAQEEIGKRNLFQYQQLPPPPPPVQRGALPNSSRPFETSVPSSVTPPIQSRPPAPPPIPLKYQGFALTSVPNRLIAFVADDTRHYNVTAGEILMGRYRIVNITEKSVEVEDLDFNRRQTLPLVK